MNVVQAFGIDNKRAKHLYIYRPNDLNESYVTTFTHYGYSKARIVNHFGLARLVQARGRNQAVRHGIKVVDGQGVTWKESMRTSHYPYGRDRSDIRKSLAARIHNV